MRIIGDFQLVGNVVGDSFFLSEVRLFRNRTACLNGLWDRRLPACGATSAITGQQTPIFLTEIAGVVQAMVKLLKLG